MSELNAPAELVLRSLDATPTRALLKAAVKELVAAGCWRVTSAEVPAGLMGRKRKTVSVLEIARADAPPGEPLSYVHWLIGQAPSGELGEIAKSIAQTKGAPREALERTLVDLVASGLVEVEEARTLGVFKRRRHRRTPAGDALLATLAPAPDPWRRRHDPDWTDTTPGPLYTAGAAGAGATVAAEALPDDPHLMDDALEQVEGAMESFDASFEASFDAAFDSSFDAAFDSGFDSGGGGDFGGGDSGGDSGGGGGGD